MTINICQERPVTGDDYDHHNNSIMAKQPTQIFAKKAQLSARVVIPPVGLKLEENFKDGMLNYDVIGSLCHHS